MTSSKGYCFCWRATTLTNCQSVTFHFTR